MQRGYMSARLQLIPTPRADMLNKQLIHQVLYGYGVQPSYSRPLYLVYTYVSIRVFHILTRVRQSLVSTGRTVGHSTILH